LRKLDLPTVLGQNEVAHPPEVAMRVPPRPSRRRRAAASVELALVLPFLGFLFVVGIDYARIFYFAVTLENCARNGAYYASNYPNANDIYNDIYGYSSLDDAVLRDSSNLIDPNNSASKPTYQVGYGTSPTGPFNQAVGTADGYVQVTVNWTYQSLTRYPGLPTSVNLSRAVIMRVAPAIPSFAH
jgi:Flp pilus assembly protein TadG